MKCSWYIILTIFFMSFKAHGQCNLDATVCDQNFHGPFSFVSPGNQVSSCLDFISQDYAYIILYITSDGPLNLLIDGNSDNGFLDVSVFNIPNGENPCTAINNQNNEISCNYADFANGCNQFGNNFACTSTVPAPLVDSGDVLMIVVEDWSDQQSTFELYLGNGAQTGVPTVNIDDPGQMTDLDPALQLTNNAQGGAWGASCGACLTNQGVFDPAIAGVGIHEITYSIGSGACFSGDTITIEVISGCSNDVGDIKFNNAPAVSGQLICFNETLSITSENFSQIPAVDANYGIAVYNNVPSNALPFNDPALIDFLVGPQTFQNNAVNNTLQGYINNGFNFTDNNLYIRLYTLSNGSAAIDADKLDATCFDSSTVFRIQFNPEINITRTDPHCSRLDSAIFIIDGGASDLFASNFDISNINPGTALTNIPPNTALTISGINTNNSNLSFIVMDQNNCEAIYNELYYNKIIASIVSFDDTTCGMQGNVALQTNYGNWDNFGNNGVNYVNNPNPTSFSLPDTGNFVLQYEINNNNICRDTLNFSVYGIDTTINIINTPQSCFDTCDGSIQIQALKSNQLMGTLSLNGNNIPAGPPLFYDQLCPNTYTFNGLFNGLCPINRNITNIPKDSLKMTVSNLNIPCFGAEIDVNITHTGGQGAISYHLNTDTNNIGTFNNIGQGTYQVGVLDGSGCYIQDSITLIEPTAVDFTFTLEHPHCTDSCDGIINYQATGGTPYPDNSYRYFTIETPGMDSSNAISGNKCDGSYHIYVKDANYCSSDTVIITLIDPAPFTIQIDTIIGHSCFMSCDAEIQITGSELFSLNGIGPNTTLNDGPVCDSIKRYTAINNQGCVIDTLIRFPMPQPLQVNFIGSDTVCSGVAHEISIFGTGGTAPYQYLLSGGIDSNIVIQHQGDTLIQGVIRDANNCTNSRNIIIRVYDPIQFHHHDSLSTCFGNDLDLIADYTGGDPNSTTLYWLVNGDTLFSGHHWNIGNTDTSFMAEIHASDQCMVNYIDSMYITIHEKPGTPLNYQLLSSCGSGAAIFNNNLNDPSIIYNIEIINQGIYRIVDSLTIDFNQVGCYDIKVITENQAGCLASQTWSNEICINPSPVASFTHTPNVINYHEPFIDLYNNSSNAHHYTWLLGASGSSFDEDVHLVLHDSLDQAQQFCLIAYDTLENCPDTLCKTVEVIPELHLWAPNTFSPNTDGTNDHFSVHIWGADISQFRVSIYNRWGHLIYESNDVAFQWDGKEDEEHIGKGTYRWVIDVKDMDSDDIKRFQGNVLLLR